MASRNAFDIYRQLSVTMKTLIALALLTATLSLNAQTTTNLATIANKAQ